MRSQHKSISSSATAFSARLLVALALWLSAAPLRAVVCVWRDPERTMQKLFPQARDYKTRTLKMTPERIDRKSVV